MNTSQQVVARLTLEQYQIVLQTLTEKYAGQDGRDNWNSLGTFERASTKNGRDFVFNFSNEKIRYTQFTPLFVRGNNLFYAWCRSGGGPLCGEIRVGGAYLTDLISGILEELDYS